MIDQVRAYCVSHQLLIPGTTVVAAVSGGADSLALLHVLLTLRDSLDLTLHVATLDHQIRSAASAEDVQFVIEVAATWGIPCIAGSINIPSLAKDRHMGLEEAARMARYNFLSQVARYLGGATIATGHNQDDQAETVLMHAIRGSGLAGLRGMLPKVSLTNGLALIRPLLNTPRIVIDAYVQTYLQPLGILPRQDTTNMDTAYTRNHLRQAVMPLLAQINPQVRSALARTAEIAREDYAALESALPALSKDHTGLSIERDIFLTLATSQRRLLIQQATNRLTPGNTISFERTAAAIALIETQSPQVPARQLPLGGDVWLTVNTHRILFSRPGEDPFPHDCPFMAVGTTLAVDATGIYTLPGSVWQLHVEQLSSASLPPTQVQDSDPLSVILAMPSIIAIHGPLQLRTRQYGDRFKPHGLHGQTQKLSDTLINLKVPARWRNGLPLLVINNEIAWFVAPTPGGVRSRVSESFALQADEQRILWRFAFLRYNAVPYA
ncbi:MAG: tRNA lysidine(34) synthetase TilS [Chloroflexota bacterium]